MLWIADVCRLCLVLFVVTLCISVLCVHGGIGDGKRYGLQSDFDQYTALEATIAVTKLCVVKLQLQ